MYYSDEQQWLQANIGSGDVTNQMITVETVKPTGDASWVMSYLLIESKDGKDWTELETPLGQSEGVSIHVFLSSMETTSYTISGVKVRPLSNQVNFTERSIQCQKCSDNNFDFGFTTICDWLSSLISV